MIIPYQLYFAMTRDKIQPPMAPVKYSWILPIHNETLSLPQLMGEIKRAMVGKNYEIIAVNDASKDNSLTSLTTLTTQNRKLKIINFRSRQGKWAALLAGFKASNGEIIITLDSDLQDDPREVNKLLNKLKQGYDLVSGARVNRHDPLFKVFTSRLGNSLASFLTGRHFRDINSSFKIYKREVLENLPKHGSMLRFTMLFAHNLGYKVTEVPVNHRLRLYGKSKFGVVKYLRILYDLILVMLLFAGSGRLRKLK